MELILLRHGDAADALEWASTQQEDHARPLTTKGQRKMIEIVRGLRHLVPVINIIAASPLLRANQTAEILSETYDHHPITTLPQLAPGLRPMEMVDWLENREDDTTIVLVGHEPDLGRLATWLLARKKTPFLSLKKGGAAFLELTWKNDGVEATLHWLLTPRQLRVA